MYIHVLPVACLALYESYMELWSDEHHSPDRQLVPLMLLSLAKTGLHMAQTEI